MHERSRCCWVAVLPPSLSRDGGGNCSTTIRACSCSCPYCCRSFFVLLLLSNCYALGAATRSLSGLVRATVLILPQLVQGSCSSLFSVQPSPECCHWRNTTETGPDSPVMPLIVVAAVLISVGFDIE
ncbi:uncharacterized protein LOC130960437 [Arachis stenosperma]|uniref:uncharacterized protein LOC130960437 n=1 Tax=Arachis stenosperma TaxID=217475 RepID=UPI0025ACFFB3|nr:uncharacterized protein LOC130960437 [Arachis stenosperma]